MKRHRYSGLVGMILFGTLVTLTGAAHADKKGLREVEEVSAAEKVQWARATKVPITEAIRTATARTPGQVIEAELASFGGRLLFEIEIVTKDGQVVELYVDPQSGKLIELGEKK